MITGTLFFSEKAKAAIDKDAPKLMKEIEELVAKATGYKATIGLAGSVLAGADVSVDLFDVNNMPGVKVDAMAYSIKVLISTFFLRHSLIINPLKIPVTTRASVAS